MRDEALDAALDELYAVDPSEFVAVRKRLSAMLRTDGDKAGAKQLLAARRPSTSAWAVNQLARREPELVEHLLDASRALFAAQTRGSNQPDVLRDAIRLHRDAVDAATDAALLVLGDRAHDKFRSEIVSTLRAVSTEADISEQLRAGRIVREASSSGFPDAMGLTLVPDLPKPTAPAKPKPKPKPVKVPQPDEPEAGETEAAAVAAQEARDREAEEQRRAHLAAKETARTNADAAAAEADRAQSRVEELEAALETARRDLQTARSNHRKAKSTLRDLR